MEVLGNYHTHPYLTGTEAAGPSGADIDGLTDASLGNYRIIETGVKRYALEVVDRKKFIAFANANDLREMYNTIYEKTPGSVEAKSRAATRFVVQQADSGLAFYESTDPDKLRFREVE